MDNFFIVWWPWLFLVPSHGVYTVNVRSLHIHTTYSPYYRELHKVSMLIRQTKWYIIAALDDNLEHDYIVGAPSIQSLYYYYYYYYNNNVLYW